MTTSIMDLLTPEEKAGLIQQATQRNLKTAEILFEKGDTANHLYQVKRGKVTLFRLMPSGEEKVFKVFLAGGIIAEMAVFMSPRVYPMSARAEQDTELLTFSYQSITGMLQSSPDMSLRFLNFMSNRICQLMNTVDILTQVNANQRLVMRFAEIYKSQQRAGNRITLPHTKRVLASQLGITPETLSRLFKKLKCNGLIKESGTHIIIPDFTSLCKSVDLTPGIFAQNPPVS